MAGELVFPGFYAYNEYVELVDEGFLENKEV
jgi:hypothetical protein